MYTKKLFLPLSVGLIATMCFSLPRAMSQPPEKQLQLINDRLNDVASLLALPLASPDFRQFIWEETKSARNPEQKLDLEATVNKAASDSEVPATPGMGIWLALDIAIDEVKRSVIGDQGEAPASSGGGAPDVPIDLYFPVDEHREKWDGGPDLLVASAPADDSDISLGIVAYSIKDGSVVILDANTPPDTPTLIIGLGNPEFEELSPPMVEIPGDVNIPDEVDAVIPDANDTNSYIGIPWVWMWRYYEFWWDGDPEVYVKVTRKVFGYEVKNTVNLPGVNYVSRWYWLGDGSRYPLYFYFSSSYDKVTRFEFWEEDTWPNPDDHMATFDINRDNVPWANYKRFANKDITIYVDKDP